MKCLWLFWTLAGQCSGSAWIFFDEKDTVLNRHCRSCGFSCPVLSCPEIQRLKWAPLQFRLPRCFCWVHVFHHRDVNTVPQPGAINSIFHSIMWVSAFAAIAVLSGRSNPGLRLLHRAEISGFVQCECTNVSFRCHRCAFMKSTHTVCGNKWYVNTGLPNWGSMVALKGVHETMIEMSMTLQPLIWNEILMGQAWDNSPYQRLK